MEKKVNKHVERLHKYLPFSPAHDQIYEEYQQSDSALNITTRALDYLVDAVRAKANLIVLTGDAGHGKTHLCRRLIETHLGYSEDEARLLINTACDGNGVISSIYPEEEMLRPLRIYKDFSEMSVDIAVERTERAFQELNEVTVVCANEGRLRAILESGVKYESCRILLERFKNSFQDGLASDDGKIHIINLNFQSVASDQQRSLFSIALNDWVSGNRWVTCKSCASQNHCPIFRNQQLLSKSSSDCALIRQEKMEALLAALERLGAVITIREMLMITAFFLTGGLKCQSIHDRIRKRKVGWQYRYAFYNLVFDPPPEIGQDKLERISVLKEFYLIDPGIKASRDIDERIVNLQNLFKEDELDTTFEYFINNKPKLIDASNGIDEIIGNPRTKSQRINEADFIRNVVRSLRRRTFFDQDSDSSQVMSSLGFVHSDGFLKIIQAVATPQEMKKLKNKIVAGLHTMQGLQMGRRESTLFVVDPAFGRAGSHAAIIANHVASTDLALIPMSSSWAVSSDKNAFLVANSVDWLDRSVVLRVNQKEDKIDLHMDLMMFNFICEAGSGYVAEDFYAHDVRRVTTFLGRLAANNTGRDRDIRLFYNAGMHSVSIDDGIIQVGGY